MAIKLALTTQYQVRAEDLPTRADFRRWVKAALQYDAELTVRVVDAAESQQLNAGYRGKHSPTNVLSFTYTDVLIAGQRLLGDLVLCEAVIRAEALAQNKSLAAHYAHLVVHGVLHLQGYDHIDEAEATAMEALETNILQELGYADPYASEKE